MALFKNQSLVKELEEAQGKFAALEKEFTDYKAANSEAVQKLASVEIEVVALKGERDTLALEVKEAKDKLALLETKKVEVTQAAVTEAAVLELQKVGQAPIPSAPVESKRTEQEIWDEYMDIKKTKGATAAHEFYQKNIKIKR